MKRARKAPSRHPTLQPLPLLTPPHPTPPHPTLPPAAVTNAPARAPGELLQQLLLVTKGHLSHIMNAGTDNSILDAAKKAHEEGKGPSVGVTLVQPNGAQLQQVEGCMEGAK
jgi:hypothetical protein